MPVGVIFKFFREGDQKYCFIYWLHYWSPGTLLYAVSVLRRHKCSAGCQVKHVRERSWVKYGAEVRWVA